MSVVFAIAVLCLRLPLPGEGAGLPYFATFTEYWLLPLFIFALMTSQIPPIDQTEAEERAFFPLTHNPAVMRKREGQNKK